MPKSSSLSLGKLPIRSKEGRGNSALSPRSPTSPRWGNPNDTQISIGSNDSEAQTPVATLPPAPGSPASPKQKKESTKNIWSNFQASKSSPRINTPEGSIRQVSEHQSRSPNSQIYPNGRTTGSTPELPRALDDGHPEANSSVSGTDHSEHHINGGSIKSNSVPNIDPDLNGARRGSTKSKGGLLSRSRSIKTEDGLASRGKLKANPPKNLPEPTSTSWKGNGESGAIKTAPLEKGQSWRQNMSLGKMRNHSADRHEGPHSEDDRIPRRERGEQTSLASSLESKGTFMSSIGSASRKMGEKMETARKGMFGKLARSGSAHERENSAYNLNAPYDFKVIHLPLVEQTRKTRISKRLEASKDKTEFWMPALPWRCIDYLNMKGCEEEGLYRIPGAEREIKHWQQRFDQELDIDLFEEKELYDINIIGSMFKAWLRDLPDEIFPKATQARIQQQESGAKSTPQLLKDELSRLPPYNYYLLFAITCHISLLHSCSELNKMNYHNLCVCFQPCMKIEPFCFQFLILDWRNCWQGCWTEKEYLGEELQLMKSSAMGPPAHPGSRNGPNKASSVSTSTSSLKEMSFGGEARGDERGSERAISSSESSKASITNAKTQHDKQSRPPPLTAEHMAEDEDNNATPTQTKHARLGSDNNSYRIEINQPPSSPFSIKF